MLFRRSGCRLTDLFPTIRRSTQGAEKVVEFLFNVYKLQSIAALKDETKFLDDAKKAEWESDELFQKRKEIIDKIKNLKNNKGPRGGKRISRYERARLLQHRLQKMLKKFDIPDCSPEKVKFITDNSSSLIYDAGLKLQSNKTVQQAKDVLVSIQEKAINDAMAAKKAEAVKYKDEADGAHKRVLELEDRKANIESIGHFPSRLVEVLDHINLLLSANDLADAFLNDGTTADKSFATLNALGSFLDAAVHYETIVKTIFKKNIDNTSAAIAKTGRHTSAVIVKESAEKILFRRLDIVSSSIDSVVSGYNSINM
jgi:hypothetical protein